MHCAEYKHCHEQVWVEKFDEEDLFEDKKRYDPSDDDEKLREMCADGQQHVRKEKGGKGGEHHGGDDHVDVAGMEIKHFQNLLLQVN